MAEKKKFNFSTMNFSDIPKFIVALFKGQIGPEEPMMSEQTGFYEINLVPDVKMQMIRMQKIRNIMFFVCIVISIASVSTALVLGSIKATQDITMSGQDSHIENLSKKILEYEELPEFLTIQNQINGISKIEDNQKVLSRAVLFLNSLLPNEGDKIEVSELSIDLKSTTLSFDAQANALKDNIDYRVLEAFIKRTNMMTFDYGRYVDSTGLEIPSRCIEEYNSAGVMYQENGNIYAIWHRGDKGCDPNRDDFAPNEDGSVNASQIDIDLNSTNMNQDGGQSSVTNLLNNVAKEGVDEEDAAKKEEEKKKKTVNIFPSEKIYRTPQFTAWYNGESYKTAEDGIDDKAPDNDEDTIYNITNYKYTPSMELDGSISGIPHFESKCITYTGEDTTEDDDKKKSAKWTADNQCILVPEGVQVTQSANGRDADDNLVLTFSSVVQINADAFAFRNKHVMAIGPNGQNVTDSYLQLEDLFAAPATKCTAGDTECNNAPTGGKE